MGKWIDSILFKLNEYYQSPEYKEIIKNDYTRYEKFLDNYFKNKNKIEKPRINAKRIRLWDKALDYDNPYFGNI